MVHGKRVNVKVFEKEFQYCLIDHGNTPPMAGLARDRAGKGGSDQSEKSVFPFPFAP
jgi:hypothetical protein